MVVSLQDALERLRSDRVKDRQEGLEQIDQIFRDPRNVANLDPKGDGKAWLKTFQSLFACVLLEKAVCLKKGSIRSAQPVALSRLRDSAYAVRQLVERSVNELNRRVIKSLLSHLVQMLEHQGSIFAPVSMSYLKALSCILQFGPHVDQLEVEEWTLVASLCFNALLDQELSQPLGPTPNDAASSEAASPLRSAKASPRTLGLEDIELLSCLQHLLSSPNAPLLTEEQFGLHILGRYAIFLELYPAECSSHLPAVTGLQKLLRELELNETIEVIKFSTRVWRSLSSLWSTKNKLLKEQLVICYRILVPVISSCLAATFDGWTCTRPTLSAVQAEARLTLADLHRLIANEQGSRWGSRPIPIDCLRLRSGASEAVLPFQTSTISQGAAFGEADALAWAILDLNATTLVGLLPPPPEPLPLRHLAATQEVPQREASVLADAEETLTATPTASPTKRSLMQADQPSSKRRRTGTEPGRSQSGTVLIDSLLSELRHPASARASTRSGGAVDRLWRLQQVFFVLVSWTRLEPVTRQRLVETLLEVVGESSADIQSWGFLCFAELASQVASADLTDSALGADAKAAFSQAWTLACRRFPAADITRAAAHLASAMLRFPILPKETLLTDLRVILTEVEIQGPACLCDSVADFMMSALEHASKDAQLFSLQLGSKALSWLLALWQPGGASGLTQAPTRSPNLAWTDLFGLLCRISGHPASLVPVAFDANVRHTSIAACLEEERELVQLRSFLLLQDLPIAGKAEVPWTGLFQRDGPKGPATPQSLPMSAEERRIYNLLERSVSTTSSTWLPRPNGADSPERVSARACGPDQASALLDLALLSLLFDAILAEKGVSTSGPLAASAAKLVDQTVTFVASRHDWTSAERLSVIGAFGPLLPASKRTTLAPRDELLVYAGSKSGVRDCFATVDKADPTFRDEATDDALPSCFWRALLPLQGRQGLADAVYSILDQELESRPRGGSRPGSTQPGKPNNGHEAGDSANDLLLVNDNDDDDDGFIGRARLASHDDVGTHRDRRKLQVYSKALVSVCVDLLVEGPKMAKGTGEPTHDERLVNLMFEGTLESVMKLGPCVVRTVCSGSLWLARRDIGDLLDQIGSDLLTSYRFARDQEARSLAIALVGATMPSWLGGKRVHADLLEKLRKLCIFFSEQVTRQKWRSPWRVRKRAAEFLDLYLRHDPHEALWTEEDELISRCPPSEAVLHLNCDLDVRIRVAGAVISAHLFSHLQRDDDGFASLYEKLKDRLPLDHAKRENVATRVVCLTNVTIASSSVRRISLFHLLEIFLVTGLLEPTLKSAFETISSRLGFTDPRVLYKCFAGQVTWGMITNSYDPLKVPHKILGFRSRKDCIEQTFKESGSMMLAASTDPSRNYFGTLARMARRTIKEGIRECLPFLAASQLGFLVDEQAGAAISPASAKTIFDQALETIHQWNPDEEPAETSRRIASAIDELVLVLLTMLYEPGLGSSPFSETPLAEALRRKDQATYQTFVRLTLQPATTSEKRTWGHEPNRPFFAGSVICESILVLESSGLEPTSTRVAYHVLRQMFFKIGTSPFVNDQYRFFEAVKLYVSMCSELVQSSPLLLDTLLQGIGFLVEQRHMHIHARPLADWLFAACSRLGCLPARIASTLTAFALQSNPGTLTSGSLEPGSPDTARLELRKWAEDAVIDLLQSSGSVEAGQLALHLWPDAVPARLKDSAMPSAEINDLASALQRCPGAVVTAAVLDRLRTSLKSATATERDAFARSTVWLLFDRLKQSGRPSQPAVEAARTGQALAEILHICEGRLQTPGRHALGSLSSSEICNALGSIMHLEEPGRGIQAVAILAILEHLQSRSIAQAEKAYFTLRGALSASTGLTSALPKWPGHVHEELCVLAEFAAAEPSSVIHSKKSLDDTELVKAAADYDGWIRSVSGIISRLLVKTTSNTFYHHVQALVESDGEIAARLLPLLMQLFTADGGLDGTEEAAKYLDAGREAISLHFQEVLLDNGNDPRSWTAILEGLLHVRRWRVLESDPTYSDLWYSIDFLLLARRSLDCKMYTAGLLFIELFFEHSTDAKDAEQREGTISALLYDVYSNVEDPDGFYGIDNVNVLESLTKRLHHEGEWQRALQLHAAEYETAAIRFNASSSSHNGSLVDMAFHKLGFHSLASTLDRAGRTGNQQRMVTTSAQSGSDFEYDIAWRTGEWDLPVSSPYRPGTSCGTFAALRALHRDRSGASIDDEVARAFALEMQGVAGAKPEAINEIKRIQQDLLGLHEVRAWRQLVTRLGTSEAIVHVSSLWTERRPTFAIECYERILSVRQSLLQAERAKEQLNEIGNLLSPLAEESMQVERAMMLTLSAAAREQGRLQLSLNATAKAQKLHASLGDQSSATDEEFASVLWAQGEHAFAMALLGSIIDSHDADEPATIRQRHRKAVLMAQLGEWRATARSQQPRMIDTTLFKPALELLVAQDGHARASEEQAEVAYKWARFADEQYRGVNVEEIGRLRIYIDRRKEEIRQNQVESDKTSSKSLKARLMQFQRQAEKILRQDQAHLKELESARTLFLQRAMAMYSRSLTMSDRQDDAVGRLTSLWFENSFDESANVPLSASLPQIPSYKFLPLTHQLSARLSAAKGASKGTSMFQTNLSALVLRMCQDHPFHTLYAIFALLKAGNDAKAVERSLARDRSLGEGAASSQRQRSLAAEGIWASVRTTAHLKKRVQALEEVCQAYVEWAEVNLSTQFDRYFGMNGVIKKGPLKMPSSSELKLSRLSNVDVAVATADVPVDKTCQYRDIVSIVRYSETFTTAGGIHLPKITECIGSDGKRYKQLFKRDDDLRQDAVMQQVFRLVNGLLDRDRRASQRQLTVRTYAVIPLGPQCGMLEFVTNTVPIGEVLIKMHSRYGPSDMSPMEARTRIREAQGLTAAKKLDVFLDVCERMPPAFRFFFTETHKDPPSWFAMRLNYTRSVSTTSIVGHVLGLGDRHVSNILLDRQSGEVVHIDFGVAFDQGKLLPIPELVPFRLTRDLVDGMGLSGIEGTFRRCCEETLRVLRDGRDVVKTVLEVFKHDPLFAWTSNPIKVLKAQGAAAEDEAASFSGGHASSSRTGIGGAGRPAAPSVEPPAASIMTIDTAELSADRAITSVMTKLSSSLSVEYTVNELIQQAMDAGNLSAIFQGWQAAL